MWKNVFQLCKQNVKECVHTCYGGVSSCVSKACTNQEQHRHCSRQCYQSSTIWSQTGVRILKFPTHETLLKNQRATGTRTGTSNVATYGTLTHKPHKSIQSVLRQLALASKFCSSHKMWKNVLVPVPNHPGCFILCLSKSLHQARVVPTLLAPMLPYSTINQLIWSHTVL